MFDCGYYCLFFIHHSNWPGSPIIVCFCMVIRINFLKERVYLCMHSGRDWSKEVVYVKRMTFYK